MANQNRTNRGSFGTTGVTGKAKNRTSQRFRGNTSTADNAVDAQRRLREANRKR